MLIFLRGSIFVDTDAFSASSEEDGASEDDGYRNVSFTANGHFYATDLLTFGATLRVQDSKTDLDKFGGAGGDDPNYKGDIRRIFFEADGQLFLLDDRWEQNLVFQLLTIKETLMNTQTIFSGYPVGEIRRKHLVGELAQLH